jgi:hypothetical protein
MAMALGVSAARDQASHETCSPTDKGEEHGESALDWSEVSGMAVGWHRAVSLKNSHRQAAWPNVPFMFARTPAAMSCPKALLMRLPQ